MPGKSGATGLTGLKYEVTAVLPNGLGRAGVITTPHGQIKTPAFMVVGTRGQVRYLDVEQLRQVQAQAMLCNGYHLRKQAATIAETGGLASWNGWQGPTLTDSGGFQVMSLGSGLGKVVSMERENGVVNTAHKERLAHVTESGVDFTDPFTGEPDFIGPEESMQIQCQIGADIHMAFDELTSLADSYEYNVEALARTERWAERSLAEHQRHRDDLGYRQSLYGVLQGGRWEDLRRSTAQKLGQMEFDGYGLGGAFLKEDLGEILRWCDEELPFDKPRHLLGLSRPDDIFVGAEMGADTFDCVAPTREARHGKIYTLDGDINLRKFAGSDQPLDEDCDCPTCRAGWTRGQLRALWRSGNLSEEDGAALLGGMGMDDDVAEELAEQDYKELYYHLASAHNVRFIIRLTEQIRDSIVAGEFEDFKEKFLKRYYHK